MWYGIITGTWRRLGLGFRVRVRVRIRDMFTIHTRFNLKSIPRPFFLGRFSDAIVQNKFSIWMTTWRSQPSILSFAVFPFFKVKSRYLRSSTFYSRLVSYLRSRSLLFEGSLTTYQHCPWIEYFHIPSTIARSSLVCENFSFMNNCELVSFVPR